MNASSVLELNYQPIDSEKIRIRLSSLFKIGKS